MTAEIGGYATGISVDDAYRMLGEIGAKRALSSERVALELALGRMLAREVVAPRNVPGFLNSAMDGFAVRGVDLPASAEKTFDLIGEILAGGPEAPAVAADQCVRITTGAPLPHGADTVVMKENTRIDGDKITIGVGTPPGANVRAADEDYREGDVALSRGTRLTAARLGVLASFGMNHVDAVRQPRVVLLTTGDELTAPGDALGFGRIYDSNRYSLGGLIEQGGMIVLRHERVRDDPAVLRGALLRAGADADVIISSGGVSAGEADYLPGLVAAVGKIHLWKVRMKPGMPFLCGEVGQALVFALPGNPVSGMAIFLALVAPVIERMAGVVRDTAPIRARLARAIRKNHPRTEFLRCSLESRQDGSLWALAGAKQGSGMLRGMAEADALMVVPEAVRELDVGDVVEVLPLSGWPWR